MGPAAPVGTTFSPAPSTLGYTAQPIIAPYTAPAPLSYTVSGAGALQTQESFVASAPLGTTTASPINVPTYAAPAPVSFGYQASSTTLPAAGASVVMGSTPSGGEIRVPQ